MSITHSLDYLHVVLLVGFTYFNSWIHATGSILLTLILEMEIRFTPTHMTHKFRSSFLILFFPLSHLPLFLATPITILTPFKPINHWCIFFQNVQCIITISLEEYNPPPPPLLLIRSPNYHPSLTLTINIC